MGRGAGTVDDAATPSAVGRRKPPAAAPQVMPKLTVMPKPTAAESATMQAMQDDLAMHERGWGTTVKTIVEAIYGKQAATAEQRAVQTALRSLRKKGLAESNDLGCPWLFWRPIAPWTLEQVKIEETAWGDDPAYIALLDERQIGHLRLHEPDSDGRYTIRNVQVDPGFRRRGVATLMLNACRQPVEHDWDETRMTAAGRAWALATPAPSY